MSWYAETEQDKQWNKKKALMEFLCPKLQYNNEINILDDQYEFCWLLKNFGIYMPFTVFTDNITEEQYYGETLH